MSPEPDRGVTQPLFYSSCSTLQPNSYLIGSYHRILGSQDLATHWDSAGGVHLRPPPPKWADGHWEAHPTSHAYWMELPTFHCLIFESTWEGLTLGPALSALQHTRKKTGHGGPGETPCLSPYATRGALQHPNAFQQTLHCCRLHCCRNFAVLMLL